MADTSTNELRMTQIATGLRTVGGHVLYGVTDDGRVFVFESGPGGWRPLPMKMRTDAT